MNITLEDCRWMEHLIKFHQVWNSGEDWCCGSPSYGLLKYVLPDHDVIILRGHQYLNPQPGSLGVCHHHLSVSHADLVLEATWSNWFKSYADLYNYDVFKSKHEDLDFQYKLDVTWVGDPMLFQEWLTEFKLWNSLTDCPVML